MRTLTKNKNEDLDARKRKTAEFVLGENVANAVQALATECKTTNHQTSTLVTLLERYANFEKTIGLMLTTHESEVATFLNSETPISKLLNKDIPAINAAKKDLDSLIK